MKKILILIAMMAIIGGCCTSPNNSKKSFGNCVAKFATPVKAELCPPNQEQIDQAIVAAAFLGDLAGQDWTAEIALARQTFLNVAASICVTLDQLQFALGQFDAVVEVEQGQAMLKGIAGPKVPDVSALRKALRK